MKYYPFLVALISSLISNSNNKRKQRGVHSNENYKSNLGKLLQYTSKTWKDLVTKKLQKK